jgi:hypothetical protein
VVEQDGICSLLDMLIGRGGTGFAKFLRTVEWLSDGSPLLRKERMKKLTAEIFEIKTGELRVLCFFESPSILMLTNGFTMPTSETVQAEAISIAQGFLRDFQEAKLNDHLSFREDYL